MANNGVTIIHTDGTNILAESEQRFQHIIDELYATYKQYDVSKECQGNKYHTENTGVRYI